MKTKIEIPIIHFIFIRPQKMLYYAMNLSSLSSVSIVTHNKGCLLFIFGIITLSVSKQEAHRFSVFVVKRSLLLIDLY